MQQRQFLFIISYIAFIMMERVTPTKSTNNDFVGLFHFTKVYSDHQDIPIGEDTICSIRIEPSQQQQLIQSDDADAATKTTTFSNNNQYDIFIKIGNNMGGNAIIIPSVSVSDNNFNDDRSNETVTRSTVLAEGTITIGALRSTMMMPPPELYAIERAVSNVLPAATNIRIAVVTIFAETDKSSQNESKNNSEVVELRIEGSKGYIQANRVQ